MKLYGQCLDTENIKQAIKKIMRNEGSKTAGPDGISRKSKISEERIIKEVKLRIRKYKKVNSRTIEIPKSNGTTRKLTVCNLFDRIAQQAVYQVIQPILEKQFDNNSYGFRKGISAKIPVSRLACVIEMQKKTYTVEIDFTKCFDNIPLDKAIDMVRELGIRDGRLLGTIKHLMYVSKEYKGIGLGQGTILGPILANCYLHKLDRFIRENFETEKLDNKANRNHDRHKESWISWNIKRGKKIGCKYYRYADDTVITCKFPEEQEYIYNRIKEFIDRELEITINESKTTLGYNRVKFLGFLLVKSNNSIWIKIGDMKKYSEAIKRFNFNSVNECREFMKWYLGIIRYFDIANNVAELLNRITMRLLVRSQKHGSGLKKVEGHCIWNYEYRKHKFNIDIYKIRRSTKTSFSEYCKNGAWISRREQLIERSSQEEYNIFVWELFTKQRGKDPITKQWLDVDIGKNDIHHINGNHEDNRINNLLLLSKESHREIHFSDSERTERYRKALK